MAGYEVLECSPHPPYGWPWLGIIWKEGPIRFVLAALVLLALTTMGGGSNEEVSEVRPLAGVDYHLLSALRYRDEAVVTPTAVVRATQAPQDVLEVVPVPVPTLVEMRWVPVTFYACLGPRGGFCGAMAGGEVVYAGAAACGYGWVLGERFQMAGAEFTCADRGSGLSWWQVDVWFYSEADGWVWQAEVGTYVPVEVFQ